MKKSLKFIMRLVLISSIILLLMPEIMSCTPSLSESLDDVFVQVWEQDELISTGIIVGDGSQVLAILEYNESIPDKLHIVVKEKTEYEAAIEIVDFRTGMTLLKVNGGPFPTASTGDALTIKPDQKVLVFEWSRPFQCYEVTDNGKQVIFGDTIFTQTSAVTTDLTIDHPFRFGISYLAETPFEGRAGISPRDIITDLKGNVLGIVGNSYWGLCAPPSPIGWLPPVVSINAALDLLSENADEQIWTRGPTGFIFAGPGYNTAYGQAPSYYDEAAAEIERLLNTVGEPISVTELEVEDYTTFYPLEGKAVTAVYALPVPLRNTNGDILVQAKWIFIRWGVIRQSVHAIYGAMPYLPDGAFELSGDPTNLDLLELHPPALILTHFP